MKFSHAQLDSNKQRGVTLVELMIAMAISLIVLLGVISVYITSKRSYVVQEEFARMQENANFAFQYLTQDIRQAGYSGCNPVINSLLNTTAANVDFFDFSTGIQGWESVGSGPGVTVTNPSMTPLAAGSASSWKDYNNTNLHSALAGSVIQGTDVIVIKSARELSGLTPSADVDPTSQTVTFAAATGIAQGQILVLADCEKADLFMNSSTEADSNVGRGNDCDTHTPCNKDPATVNWSHQFKRNETHVLASSSRAYFIGQGSSGEPALFRANLARGIAASDAVPEELVEGIESMQILYGEDRTPNNGTFSPTRYVPINAVTDVNNIVSVRISLLMRTPKELDRPPDTKTYLLAGVNAATGTEIDPTDDKRMRKTFTTTVVLRNKLVTGRKITF